MKNITSWLLVMFMAMFWVFRVIIAFQAQYEKDFGGFIAFISLLIDLFYGRNNNKR